MYVLIRPVVFVPVMYAHHEKDWKPKKKNKKKITTTLKEYKETIYHLKFQA